MEEGLLLSCTAATAVGVGAPQVASAAPPAPRITEISCYLSGDSDVHWRDMPHGQGVVLDPFWIIDTPFGTDAISTVRNLSVNPAGSLRLPTPPDEVDDSGVTYQRVRGFEAEFVENNHIIVRDTDICV